MTIQTEIPTLAQECANAMYKDDLAAQHLGIALLKTESGQASMRMHIKAHMLNGHGTCHGGYIFTLADTCFAFACNTYNQRTVAQHCSITYLAPAFENDELTAHAREITRQGRSGLYDVIILNQDGKHIAEFRGHARTIKGTLLPTEQA